MSDSRLFIKVHHNFPEHAKTEELSDKAFRHLVAAWCFCARNLTDGMITIAQSRKLFTPKTIGELLAAPYMHETTTGYRMHEFIQHQMSAADVSDLREKRAAAGKLGGQAKARNVASASPDAKQTPPSKPSKSLPDLEVEEELELTTTKTKNSPARNPALEPDRFNEFWMAYPRKDDKAKAQAAYRTARKTASQDELIGGARRYAADPNREAGFTKLPATWLHAGSWANEPMASRNGHAAAATNNRSTTDDRVSAALNVASRLREREAAQTRMELNR